MAMQPTGDDLQPLLDTQQNQLGFVMDVGTSIDTKALAILASNVALIIFIQQTLQQTDFWQLSALLAPFLVSTVIILFVIWPRNYIGASVSLDDFPEYITMDKERLTLQLIADTRDAIRTNAAINQKRWRLFLAALGLAIAGTTILLVYFN